MIVKITLNDTNNPPGKLADVELHFTEGLLEELKLIGFGVWESRTGSGRNVTFPARQYSVNGDWRSFSRLRPIGDVAAQDRTARQFARHTRRMTKRKPSRLSSPW